MGETVRLRTADGFEPSAYVARPAGTAKGALVVIQEIFGVNGHIRRVADGFAADGYLAIAPALFDRIRPGITLGYGENEIQEGIALKGQSSTENALADIAAARDFVKEAGKAAVIGYCWGGFLAWVSATRLPGLAAAVSYYGGGIGTVAQETAAMPGADAFRREGPRHSARPTSRRCGRRTRRASRSTSIRPATASTATSARATTPTAPASRASARWLSSTSICAEINGNRGS